MNAGIRDCSSGFAREHAQEERGKIDCRAKGTTAYCDERQRMVVLAELGFLVSKGGEARGRDDAPTYGRKQSMSDSAVAAPATVKGVTGRFKEPALKGINSSEPFDQRIRVIPPATRLLAASTAVVCLAALAWAVFGSIPTRVIGRASCRERVWIPV